MEITLSSISPEAVGVLLRQNLQNTKFYDNSKSEHHFNGFGAAIMRPKEKF